MNKGFQGGQKRRFCLTSICIWGNSCFLPLLFTVADTSKNLAVMPTNLVGDCLLQLGVNWVLKLEIDEGLDICALGLEEYPDHDG